MIRTLNSEHLDTGHEQHHDFDIRWFKTTVQLEDSKTVVLIRRVLSFSSANAEYEELSFPSSVNLHDKVPESPSDHRHLLKWSWLKIEFTNDGGQ